MFRFPSSARRFFAPARWRFAAASAQAKVLVADAQEASFCLAFAVGFGVTGVTAIGLAYFRNWLTTEKIPPGVFQKLPRLSQDGSSTWSCGGELPGWQQKTLHLRGGDLGGRSVSLDQAATARIGGSWSPECEVVRLHPSSAEALGLKHQEAPFFCLRVADSLPQGVVTVELKPGNGLLELYGQPGLYHMQDESLLRSAEMAKGGSYSAVDIFSGRSDRVLRALEALERAEGKCGEAELQVLVDERPSSMAEAMDLLQVKGAPDAQKTREAAAPLLGVIARLLDARAEAFSGLLVGILRAQCAGDALKASCAQLHETTSRRGSGEALTAVSVEDLEIAMKRGYWSLPPDQSGLHLREREAERLLDRTKRELWQEGSASRLELEKQIRKFLCLHLLGDAACQARLRFSFARPKTMLEQEALSKQRFVELQSLPEIWYRLELSPLHLKSL